jgi:hypothetical protein
MTLSSDLSIEGAYQPNKENDKSLERDALFPIWLDALSQPSIR